MIKYIIALLFLFQCNDSIFGQKSLTENLTENEKNMLAEGKKAAQKGDLKKSNKHFESLIKSRPDFIEVRLRLATNYYQQKLYENSEEMFQDAIKLSPDYDN